MSKTNSPTRRKTKTSAAKIKANQENAQKSTGPVTPLGKSVSARNSTKFGMTTTVAVLPTEDRIEYLHFSQGMFFTLYPVCTEEESLALEIINQTWRLRRCADMEVTIFEKGQSNLEILTQINKLSLHEARLTRNREKTRNMLRESQIQRMRDQLTDETAVMEQGEAFTLDMQLRMMGFDPAKSALAHSIQQQMVIEYREHDEKLLARRSVDQELKDRLEANQASMAISEDEMKAIAAAQMQHYKQQAEALALKLGFVLTPVDQTPVQPAAGNEKPPQ